MATNYPPTQEEIAKAMALFRAKEKQRLEFAEKYGDMRVPRVVRAGNKLYYATGAEFMRKRMREITIF